jgi:hypothetical protein
MGKVIQLPPRRPARLEPEASAAACACGHKANVHIRHPNGVISCAARNCRCESRPKR